MPVYVLIFFVGLIFALLCLPFLLILVIGIVFNLRTLKWIGGIGASVIGGLVILSIVAYFGIGVFYYAMIVAGPNTRTEPDLGDLAGTYRPTSESIKFVKRSGYASIPNISIVLRDNGTFEMQNIPDMWIDDFGYSKGNFISGSGEWKLDSRAIGSVSHWGITIDFKYKEDSKPAEKGEGFYLMLDLMNQEPPYIIHMTIGDPDSGEALDFEKITENYPQEP